MKKKADLLAIIISTILISVISMSLFINKYGLIKIDQQIIRISLTLILSYFLYLEKHWARWLWVAFFYIAGISGCPWIIDLFKNSFPIAGIILLVISLFYITSATYIAFFRNFKFNKSIKTRK